MSEIIQLDDGSSLLLEPMANNKINIKLRDPNGNIYILNNYILENFDSQKDFFDNLRNNKPKMEKKDNEIFLKIGNKGETIALSLSTTPNDTVGAPPLAIPEDNTKTPGDEDNDNKEFYKEFEKLMKEKEELDKQNLKLRNDIEEKKKETDELLRIFYENRLKYQEAVERNALISQLLK